MFKLLHFEIGSRFSAALDCVMYAIRINGSGVFFSVPSACLSTINALFSAAIFQRTSDEWEPKEKIRKHNFGFIWVVELSSIYLFFPYGLPFAMPVNLLDFSSSRGDYVAHQLCLLTVWNLKDREKHR